MKKNSDEVCQFSKDGIMKRPKAEGAAVIIYGLFMEKVTFFNSRVLLDLEAFKAETDVIITNRSSDDIADVADKVFTWYLFGSDGMHIPTDVNFCAKSYNSMAYRPHRLYVFW